MRTGPRACLAALLILAPGLGRAIPPPHRRHVFSGVVSPDPGSGRPGRMTLRADCILYSAIGEGDDFCTGRYTCAGDTCPLRSGAAELGMLPTRPREQRTDPSRPAKLVLLDTDGRVCTVTGSVAYDLTSVIPAFAGRYECSDAAGTPLGGGLFGMRATKVGEPYLNLR